MIAKPPDELQQLTPNERAALADYLARLREKFADRVRHVILYGSRARGEGDEESDLDVLVVVEDGDWRFHDAVADEAVEPWLKHEVVLSPLVWSREEFDQHAEWGLLFFRNLHHDGIELWTVPLKPRSAAIGSNEPATTSKRPSST